MVLSALRIIGKLVSVFWLFTKAGFNVFFIFCKHVCQLWRVEVSSLCILHYGTKQCIGRPFFFSLCLSLLRCSSLCM